MKIEYNTRTNITRHDNMSRISSYFISIFWGLVCLKVSFFYFIPALSNIDYCLSLLILIEFGFLIINHVPRKELSILLWFFILSLFQILGIYRVFSLFALKNVLTSLIMGILVFNLQYSRSSINSKIIKYFYYMVLVVTSIRILFWQPLDNTTSGAMIFLFFCYSIIDIKCEMPGLERGVKKFHFAKLAVYWGLTLLFVLDSRSRTAVMILLLIPIFFIIILPIRRFRSFLRLLYYIFIIVLIFATIIYMFISEFDWYETINSFSQKLFNKNIDSQRPFIWRYSIGTLESIEFIFGKGTGTLPEIEAYADASFHNSFIQLVMQNGLIALTILLVIFGLLWKKAIALKYPINSLCISFIAGIILYNCFETTLIQNKSFLGMIQWFLIGLCFHRDVTNTKEFK